MSNGSPRADQSERIAGYYFRCVTPRSLPSVAQLPGRVVVLDIAFSNLRSKKAKSYPTITHRFVDKLGARLAAWVDHHDTIYRADFSDDARFILATKAEHGACPEMITPALVEEVGPVDTILCHNDFDGLASAAKWMLGGREPYPGCDQDAYAIDTRLGTPSEEATRIDHALRARWRDTEIRREIVQLLISGLQDKARWALIDEAALEFAASAAEAKRLAEGYQIRDGIAYLRLEEGAERCPYDKTELLLEGQRHAVVAVVSRGDTVTFAARFDSGINFVDLLGLSGGMPTLVSLPRGYERRGLSVLRRRGIGRAPESTPEPPALQRPTPTEEGR